MEVGGVPFPRSQVIELMVPVELFAKLTANGAHPDEGVTLKAETCAIAFIPVIRDKKISMAAPGNSLLMDEKGQCRTPQLSGTSPQM